MLPLFTIIVLSAKIDDNNMLEIKIITVLFQEVKLIQVHTLMWSQKGEREPCGLMWGQTGCLRSVCTKLEEFILH